MWKCISGTRALEGKEKDFFEILMASAIDTILMFDYLDDEPGVAAGCQAFDCLTASEKETILDFVLTALCSELSPAPELTAKLEAAVYVPYMHCLDLISLEIEYGKYTIRDMAFDLTKELYPPEDDEDIQELADLYRSSDIRLWRFAIDSLADSILWDRDFQFDTVIPNFDPNQSPEILEMLGISSGYYGGQVVNANI